jgi:hypothetical protein
VQHYYICMRDACGWWSHVLMMSCAFHGDKRMVCYLPDPFSLLGRRGWCARLEQNSSRHFVKRAFENEKKTRFVLGRKRGTTDGYTDVYNNITCIPVIYACRYACMFNHMQEYSISVFFIKWQVLSPVYTYYTGLG